LPSDILERYNTADTLVALELFEVLAPILDGVWQKDWPLYHNRTKLMNSAYRRGIRIDVAALERYIYEIDRDVDKIEAEFKSVHAENIKKWAELTGNSEADFNVGSNKQLKELFCDVLGMTGAHMTATGEKKVKDKEITREEALKQYPSFQAKHLLDWGESGGILIKRRKRLLVLSQALNTLQMAKDGQGRCHPEVKVSGTRTGRVAGGSW
jgi:DNA polymerase I-like protein with 3'-5' exonuclease and polymerase domains